jgi:hypothetical protein
MEPNVAANPEPQTPVQSFESKKSLPKWPLIIIGVVLIVILMVGVYFLGQKSALKTQTTTQTITKSTLTATPTPDSTANWKTYKSSKYGFSFEYPSDGKIIPESSNDDQVYISKEPSTFENNYLFLVTTENNQDDLTLDQILNKENKTTKFNGLSDKNTPLVNGQPNVKNFDNGIIQGYKLRTYMEGDPSGFGGALFIKNDKIFLFSLHDGNGYAYDYQEKLLDQILSTLKFTDQNQTTSITPAITNNISKVKELGIEFQIPADLKDLVYTITNSNGVIAANFSTTSLTSLDQANGGSYCNSTNAGLGIISKSSQLGHDLSDSKQIGSYYYIWNHPQATCSQNNDVINLQTKQSAELGQAFKTIELIK